MWLLCPTSLTGSLVLEDACCCFLSAAPFKVNVSRTETHFEWIIYFQPILWPQNQILPKKVLKLGNRFDFFIHPQTIYLQYTCIMQIDKYWNPPHALFRFSKIKFINCISSSWNFYLLPRQLCLELDSHHSSLLVGVSSQVHYESIEEILSVWPDMAHAACC